MKRETVTVERFFNEYGKALELKILIGEEGLQRIIPEPTVNRPGLVLAGYAQDFSYKRVQVLGRAEVNYMKSLSDEDREASFVRLFSFRIPCIVFSRNLHPEKRFLQIARQKRVPIYKCPMATVRFINQATLALENLFAPRGSVMGSMVDILGVGVIIKGESGIGKSECVLALIERGYSLVSDDVTRISVIDGSELLGSSCELTRNHMEVRGIGIINVQAMFGVRSIRSEKRVDLVVTLKTWEEVDNVDRLGMEDDFTEIMGIKVPHMTIPVKMGRDLARLVEVAALHTKLKNTGYNPAKELDERLIQQMTATSESNKKSQKELTRPRIRGS